jgi:hypothetical protein
MVTFINNVIVFCLCVCLTAASSPETLTNSNDIRMPKVRRSLQEQNGRAAAHLGAAASNSWLQLPSAIRLAAAGEGGRTTATGYRVVEDSISPLYLRLRLTPDVVQWKQESDQSPEYSSSITSEEINSDEATPDRSLLSRLHSAMLATGVGAAGSSSRVPMADKRAHADNKRKWPKWWASMAFPLYHGNEGEESENGGGAGAMYDVLDEGSADWDPDHVNSGDSARTLRYGK